MPSLRSMHKQAATCEYCFVILLHTHFWVCTASVYDFRQSPPVHNKTVIFLISPHMLGWTMTTFCMLPNMSNKTKFLFPEWDMTKYQQWTCPLMWTTSGTSNRCLLRLGQEHHSVTHGTQISVMMVMMMISVRLVTWIGSWHWNAPSENYVQVPIVINSRRMWCKLPDNSLGLKCGYSHHLTKALIYFTAALCRTAILLWHDIRCFLIIGSIILR